MSKHLQRDMDQIRGQLLDLFGAVEQMIENAVRALCERRPELASEVIASDDHVDQQEVQIEEECLKIMALHQPVASNLRVVATMVKINADLERIADLACNIAERAISLSEFQLFPIPDDLPEMASETTEMLRLALDAFVNMDVELAERVIPMDERIDAKNLMVIFELRDLMKENPDFVEPALHCFSGARHIERIGDLAENIAEDVLYIVNGTIVRHNHHAFLTEEAQQSNR